MFKRKEKYYLLAKQIDRLTYSLNKSRLMELSELMGNWKEIIIKNFLSGIFKGMGIGIGFTIITAILIYILQKIVKLNIPIIGQYISDIVEIVEMYQRNK